MNILDIIIVACALLAAIMGYRSGLLASLATILGYVVAAPIAVVLTPKVAPYLSGNSGLAFIVVLCLGSFALGALMRSAARELTGEHDSPFDRLAGALLGIVRVALLAILMVVIFDQIIPQDRTPAWLKDSRLQPYLLAAGQRGLRSLPPDVTEMIDRMKRERGL